MVSIVSLVGFCLFLAVQVQSHAIPDTKTNDSTTLSPQNLFKRAVDPADFNWIKRWAAVGDSYTSGIGAGNLLGDIFHNKEDYYCSRYDASYPMILNKVFGPAVQKFLFPACSGDNSQQIYDQVDKMEGNLDLVMMTAGGNDLCLASMIKKCIILPWIGADGCNEVIDAAQANIGNIMKPNIKKILLHLNDKMNKDAVVVYNLYAQFFNTDNEEICTKNQDWTMPSWWQTLIGTKGLPLDIALRKKLNGLVVALNDAIKDVVNDVRATGNIKYHLGVADWDPWVWKGVHGQFCDPQSSGVYPDKNQPDLQFFKPNTYIYSRGENMELKRRNGTELAELTSSMELQKTAEGDGPQGFPDLYDSVLYKSPSSEAEALHLLNPRDSPAPPTCPGDKDSKWNPLIGLGLAGSFNRIFHPNDKGHITIASFALQKMIQLRAEALGLDSSCKLVDSFTCWSSKGSHSYASGDRMNENYNDFCNSVKVPNNVAGWSFSKTYHEGTPDEHTMSISLSNKVFNYDKSQCQDSMNKIINSCDKNENGQKDSHLDKTFYWKMGGLYQRGEYSYRIDVKRDNRPWPPPSTMHGDCNNKYKVFLSSFAMHGGGWATHDFGKDTLKKMASSCVGSEVTSWKFWYYDKPDENGNEWAASFNTPIWTKARCFANNKVQKGATGWTNELKKNKQGGYNDGCSGDA